MKEKSGRMPWNPFPLASLSVKGLTACAKSVLIYLAARSNYTGWTCVGHERICDDLVRSKDFVTRGLKELYEKRIVAVERRGRKSKQGDARTISKDILSPEQQDYIGQLDGSSPDSPEASSPAHQGDNQISSPDSDIVVLTGSVKPCSIEPPESQNQTSQEGLSECVSGTLATLATRGSDASHPQTTPTGKAEKPVFTREQIRDVRDAINHVFGYMSEPSMSAIKRILVAHPDFKWDYKAMDMLKKKLTERASKGKKGWKDYIKSQDDLAFRWESPKKTGTSLYDQMMRALGRGPQEEILIETPDEDSAKKFEMTVEDEPAQKSYLEGEVDLDEDEPEPKPKPVVKPVEIVPLPTPIKREPYKPRCIWTEAGCRPCGKPTVDEFPFCDYHLDCYKFAKNHDIDMSDYEKKMGVTA
jgi:hypothetical protein